MINKYSILLSLSKLVRELNVRGFVHLARDLNDVLYKLIEDLEEDEYVDEQENDDLSAIINSVGLQEGTVPNTPWGGFTINPFFFDGGDIRY